METNLDIFLILFFTAMIVFTGYIRTRHDNIVRFNRKCLDLARDKAEYLMKRAIDIEDIMASRVHTDLFMLACPDYRKMLFSFRKLTLDNWYGPEEREFLFDTEPNEAVIAE